MHRMLPLPSLLLIACAASRSPAQRDDSGDTEDTGRPPAEEEDTGEPTGSVMGTVTWSLGWDTADLMAAEQGAWRLERADGAQLELDRGWLVLTVLVLESCDESSPTGREVAPPHGLPDHPSALLTSRALALHAPEPLTLDTLDFEEERFCEVGLGLFRADGSTLGLPEEVELEGWTLWIEGRVRAGAEDDWSPLSLQSSLPVEVDLPLSTTEGSTIELRLRPAAMLDGVELSDVPDRQALGILRALAGSATLTRSP